MNREEAIQRLEENLSYLRRNIPPDDIYLFAEQNRLAALFFLRKWAEEVNFFNEIHSCPRCRKWTENILHLTQCIEENIDGQINIGFE